MRLGIAIAGGAGLMAALFLARQPILQSVATDADASKEDSPAMSPRMAEISNALKDRNVRAMLQAIRWAEGTAGPDGYRTLFGGGLFDSYADHPRTVVAALLAGKPIKSSAAGAYQILAKTWDSLKALGLPDFSPQSQDLAAVELIRRRGALQYVIDGRISLALDLIRKEWASMPGAGYGQPEKRVADLAAVYVKNGGLVA